jgi:hypothetical protein
MHTHTVRCEQEERATAIIAIFAVQGATAAKYAEVLDRLDDIGQRTPDGQSYHVCYGDADDLQVIDVFDSRAQLDAFGARLMPILQQLGIAATASIHEVHNVMAR